MSEIQYRLLTQDEVQQSIHLWGGGAVVGVAQNESGEVVSIVTFKTARAGTMCDSCVGSCVTGGIVWTSPFYQEQGIFTKLFYYTKEAAGIKRIYIHDPSPAGRLVADRYGFSIPKNIDDFPPVDNAMQEQRKDAERAIFLEGIL